MRAVKKEPGKLPEIVDIDNTLEALQDAVGGFIETLTFCEDATLIVNEEGRLLGLEHNLVFCGVPICGTALVVGVDGDQFAGLTDDAAEFMCHALEEPGGST